jgi:uncharacterized membrane protein
MSGESIAVLAALVFAFNGIVVRRASMMVSDATLGIFISVPVSIPLYIIILLAMGQIGSIACLEWQSYLWLSAAGIVHFIVGRSLHYAGTQLVGANITSLLTQLSPVVVLILGVSILNEPLSLRLISGVILIVFGVILVGWQRKMFTSGRSIFSGTFLKGILFGLSTGISWGISAILIKVGLRESAYPVAGAFISFSAATIGLGISLLQKQRRHALFKMELKTALIFCIPGLLAGVGNLLRFVALSLSQASVVIPLISTFPVMTILLSFIFNRKLEIFNINVIVGAIAVVIGSSLLF